MADDETTEVFKKAAAVLKEIMDQSSNPDEDKAEIWEAWFDRMWNHPVDLTPDELAWIKACFDDAYEELMKRRALKAASTTPTTR